MLGRINKVNRGNLIGYILVLAIVINFLSTIQNVQAADPEKSLDCEESKMSEVPLDSKGSGLVQPAPAAQISGVGFRLSEPRIVPHQYIYYYQEVVVRTAYDQKMEEDSFSDSPWAALDLDHLDLSDNENPNNNNENINAVAISFVLNQRLQLGSRTPYVSATGHSIREENGDLIQLITHVEEGWRMYNPWSPAGVDPYRILDEYPNVDSIYQELNASRLSHMDLD